jgi:hypothetical protein
MREGIGFDSGRQLQRLQTALSLNAMRNDPPKVREVLHKYPQ